LEIEADEQLDALCSGKLDAAFYVIAHPVSIVPEAAQRCGAQMIEVVGPQIRTLTEKNPAYALMNIPGGLYPGHPKPTPTFGLKAVFVAEARLPSDQAYGLVKAVFENFERFQRLHPTLETLSREEMARGSDIAPLHEGAQRFYREAKLLK
jgi:TRAP transporter TAXI family solute receptor